MVKDDGLEKLGIFLKNKEIEFMTGILGIQVLFAFKAQGVPLEQEIEFFQRESIGADREEEGEHLGERIKEFQIVTCGRFGCTESGVGRYDFALAALHLVLGHIERLVLIECQVVTV